VLLASAPCSCFGRAGSISAPTDTASVRYPNTSVLCSEGGRNVSVFYESPAEGSPWLGQPTKPLVTAGDVCLCLWEKCSALPPAQPAKRKAAAVSQPGPASHGCGWESCQSLRAYPSFLGFPGRLRREASCPYKAEGCWEHPWVERGSLCTVRSGRLGEG